MGFESYGGGENKVEKLDKDEAVEKEITILERFRKGSHIGKIFFAMMALSTNMAFGQIGEKDSSSDSQIIVDTEQVQREQLARDIIDADQIQKETDRIFEEVDESGKVMTEIATNLEEMKKTSEKQIEDIGKKSEERNKISKDEQLMQDADLMIKSSAEMVNNFYKDFKVKYGIDLRDFSPNNGTNNLNSSKSGETRPGR